MTNNDFFKLYVDYQQKKFTHNTYNTRTGIINRYLLPEFGNVAPSDVSYMDINRIYDEMNSCNYAENTIFGVYAALRSYFNMAREYGEIVENPVTLARIIKPVINGGTSHAL